jgi:hypothetical protein
MLATERKEVEFHPITGDEKTGKETDAEIAARLIEQRRPIIGAALRRANKKAQKRAKKVRVLAYDLETVYDGETGELYPYACSWFEFDPEDPPNFAECEEQTTYYVNDDPKDEKNNPLLKLLDHISAADENIKYIIEAYNGAGFDHLLLARAAMSRDRFGKLSWYNGKVYAGTIAGTHTFHDLCRFTTCSLDAACSSFQTSPVKVKGFEHTIPQEALFKGEFKEWIAKEIEKLAHYVRNDVLALCSLVVKARDAIKHLTGADLLTYPTIGKLAWDVWQKGLEVKDRPIAADTRILDQFWRSALTAGRVQILRDGGKPQKIEGQMRLFDFKSLYPTVCLAKGFGDEEFPVGYGQWTEEYLPAVQGIYYCKVIRQPDINIVPKRGEKLDWGCKEQFDAVLTSVDIEEIKKHGGEVEVGKGYFWHKSSKNMFKKYFTGPAVEKQRQDALKAEKSPEYNSALRECCKLLMNCLTGKVAQRERQGVSKIVKGAKAQHRFLSSHDDVEVFPLYAETLIMTGVPKGTPWKKQNAKPCFIACFIYSYARRCLYDMIPWAYYCDTDSALMTIDDVKEFQEQRPHRFPEEGKEAEFGHVAEELTEKGVADNYKAYLIQPKTYAVFAYDKDGKYAPGKSKMRAKGVKKTDLVLSATEAARVTHLLPTPEDRFFYSGKDENKKLIFGKEENAERMYRDMLEKKHAFVLCSQIVRSMVKNEKAFVLTQRYTVKKLSIQEPEEEQYDEYDVYGEGLFMQ